jgi:hypothetical protein
MRHSAEQMARSAALNYLFILLALVGLPINGERKKRGRRRGGSCLVSALQIDQHVEI